MGGMDASSPDIAVGRCAPFKVAVGGVIPTVGPLSFEVNIFDGVEAER